MHLLVAYVVKLANASILSERRRVRRIFVRNHIDASFGRLCTCRKIGGYHSSSRILSPVRCCNWESTDRMFKKKGSGKRDRLAPIPPPSISRRRGATTAGSVDLVRARVGFNSRGRLIVASRYGDGDGDVPNDPHDRTDRPQTRKAAARKTATG
jgi:hypothetical protein